MVSVIFNRKLIALIFCLVFAPLATAAEPKVESPLEISGRVWARYSHDLTKDQPGVKGFDIYRAFLQANYKFDSVWSSTMLIDAARGEKLSVTTPAGDETVKSGDGITKAYLGEYLRNAYIQGAFNSMATMRFGLQSTPYIAVADGASKARWLNAGIADETKLLQSVGAGVSLSGNFGEMLSYSAIMHNGAEGLTTAGNDDDSAAYGLMFGFGPTGKTDYKYGINVYHESTEPGQNKDRVKTVPGQSDVDALALTLESAWVDTAAEYMAAKVKGSDKKPSGYGLRLTVKPIEDFGVFVRYASGNEDFRNDRLKAKSWMSFGPTYTLVRSKVTTALIYESRAALATAKNTNASTSVSWNWAANF